MVAIRFFAENGLECSRSHQAPILPCRNPLFRREWFRAKNERPIGRWWSVAIRFFAEDGLEKEICNTYMENKCGRNPLFRRGWFRVGQIIPRHGRQSVAIRFFAEDGLERSVRSGFHKPMRRNPLFRRGWFREVLLRP